MRKIFFVVSTEINAKDNTIVGVVANGSGRPIELDELDELRVVLRQKGASQSLQDALRDGTYPNTLSVFDRRALAREAAAELNSAGGFFKWHVISVGESIRKPVTKPLGWRVMFGPNPSVLNNPIIPAGSAFDRVVVDHADRFFNDVDANFLFTTREDARLALSKFNNGERDPDYTIVPVYADA